MQHPYTAQIVQRSQRGPFPAMRGEIYEHGVLIGTFGRRATQNRIVPPITYRFRSTAAQNRFIDFADCLSVEETIEALLP